MGLWIMVKLDFRSLLPSLFHRQPKDSQNIQSTTKLYVKINSHPTCHEFTRSTKRTLDIYILTSLAKAQRHT